MCARLILQCWGVCERDVSAEKSCFVKATQGKKWSTYQTQCCSYENGTLLNRVIVLGWSEWWVKWKNHACRWAFLWLAQITPKSLIPLLPAHCNLTLKDGPDNLITWQHKHGECLSLISLPAGRYGRSIYKTLLWRGQSLASAYRGNCACVSIRTLCLYILTLQ